MATWLAHFRGPAMEARDLRAGESSFAHVKRELEAGTEDEAWQKGEQLAAEMGEGLELIEVEPTFDEETG